MNDSSFLDIHVRNDTRRTVSLAIPGVPGSDVLAKDQGIDEYAWRNSKPGVALVRVVRGRKTIGCLTVHYHKGQEHAFVLVTAASPCSS